MTTQRHAHSISRRLCDTCEQDSPFRIEAGHFVASVPSFLSGQTEDRVLMGLVFWATETPPPWADPNDCLKLRDVAWWSLPIDWCGNYFMSGSRACFHERIDEFLRLGWGRAKKGWDTGKWPESRAVKKESVPGEREALLARIRELEQQIERSGS